MLYSELRISLEAKKSLLSIAHRGSGRDCPNGGDTAFQFQYGDQVAKTGVHCTVWKMAIEDNARADHIQICGRIQERSRAVGTVTDGKFIAQFIHQVFPVKSVPINGFT